MQWGWSRLLSLGVHVDFKRRVTNEGIRFGPLIDLHVPGACISLGVNPVYQGELDLVLSYARGGLRA